jgi:hypothetical protein
MNIKQRIISVLATICFLGLAIQAQAVTTVYTKTALTAGTSTSLDGIDGAGLAGGDMAIVTLSGSIYFYVLDASNSGSESSPDLITPNSNPGTKRWVLQAVYGAGGSGDVTGVGDCTSGACLDGTSDGGTSISLYGGALTKKTTITAKNTAADVAAVLPGASGTLIAAPDNTTANQVLLSTTTAGLGAWGNVGVVSGTPTTNKITKWTTGSPTNAIGDSGISEDGTDINAGALNFITTGTIQGGIKISSDADGMSAAEMTAAGMYGTMFIATGAGTWILPRAVLGMSACLMDSGTAHDLILDVTSGSTIRLKGTEGSDGVGITNASGSTTGDFVCVIAVATDKWSTVGMQGTWASQ